MSYTLEQDEKGKLPNAVESRQFEKNPANKRMNSAPNQAFQQSLRTEPAGWAISSEGTAIASLLLTSLMLMLLLLQTQMLGSGLCTTTQNETLGLKQTLSSGQKQAET